MRGVLSQLAVGLGVIGLSSMALAQDAGQVPDVKGRWSGVAEGIVTGTTRHHAGSSALSEHRLFKDTFSVTIEGQDGRRFWGTLASDRAKAKIVGVIGFDGKTIQMQGERGTSEGRLLDADTIELFYGHSTEKSLVSATNLMKREK